MRLQFMSMFFDAEDEDEDLSYELSLWAASAYEVEDGDGLRAQVRRGGRPPQNIPLKDIPMDIQKAARAAFLAVGFTKEEIALEYVSEAD